MAASFESRKSAILKQLAEDFGDKSPKGSLDAPIVELIHYINALPDFVTTSSCSGRIAVFRSGYHVAPDCEGGGSASKGTGTWLLASHAKVPVEELVALVDAEVQQRFAATSSMLVRVARTCSMPRQQYHALICSVKARRVSLARV
jgi:tRNA wybutosine-synthesizing protein 3